MPTLTLIWAIASVLIGGVLIHKHFYGHGAATIGIGLISGMMYAALIVAQTIIALHH